MENIANKIRLVVSIILFALGIIGFALLVVSGVNSFNNMQLVEEGNQLFFALSGIAKFIAALIGVIFSILGLLAVKRKEIEDDIFNRAGALFVVFGLFFFVFNLLEGMYLVKVEANFLDKYMGRIVGDFLASGTSVVGAALLYFNSYFEIDSQRKQKLLMGSAGLALILVSIVLRLVLTPFNLIDLIALIVFIVSLLLACCYLILPIKEESK